MGVSHSRKDLGAGWALCKRVTVARTEMRTQDLVDSTHKPVLGMPLSDEYPALSFEVLLGQPGAGPVHLDRTQLVGRMTRGDGGSVLVVARPTLLSGDLRSEYFAEIEQCKRDLKDRFGWDGVSPTRVVLFGVDSEGFQRDIEIAIDHEIAP